MRNKILILSTIVFLLMPIFSFAQQLNNEQQKKVLLYEEKYNNYIAEGNKNLAASSLLNIAYIYRENEIRDKAIVYFKQSLLINEKIPNQNAIMHINMNLGELYSVMENYEEAINSFLHSLKMATVINDKKLIHDINLRIAILYQQLGSYRKAIVNLDKSLELSLEMKENKNIRESFLRLSECYYQLGENKKAEEFRQKYNSFDKYIKDLEHDRILQATRHNAELQRKLNEMELDTITEELEKKETKLNEVKQEKKEKESEIIDLHKTIDFQKKLQVAERKFRTGLIMIGILIIILTIAVFIGYNEKRKANIKLADHNNKIKKQKDHIVQKSNELEQALAQLKEKNQHIKDSIRYAKNIQEAMLPNIDFLMQHTKECFVLFKPLGIVSGDFYWFSSDPSDKDSFFVSAVDCTGHGVPGAFMSMIGYKLLDEAVSLGIHQPNKILSFLSNGIYTLLRQKETANQDGMDIALCRINKRTKTVEFAGAKNPLIYVYKGELTQIKGDRKGIGGEYIDEGFKLHTIKYKENIKLYLFSDGYIDQFGGQQGKKLLIKNFRNFISENAHKTMKEQRKYFAESFHAWKGDLKQVDDVLLIGINL